MFTPTIPNKIYVMVDFDGTITTDRDDTFGEYKLKENALEALYHLHDTGRVHFGLWTCRSGKQLATAENFLMQKGLYHIFEVINEDFPELSAKFNNVVSRKASADFYIEDRSLFGTEIDWLQIENYILKCLEEMQNVEM